MAWVLTSVGGDERVAIPGELRDRRFRSLLALGSASSSFRSCISHTPELNGWTRPELLALLGVQILVGGIIQSVIQPNMERLMQGCPARHVRLRAGQAGRRSAARRASASTAYGRPPTSCRVRWIIAVALFVVENE